jgi:hypothetical protein
MNPGYMLQYLGGDDNIERLRFEQVGKTESPDPLEIRAKSL